MIKKIPSRSSEREGIFFDGTVIGSLLSYWRRHPHSHHHAQSDGKGQGETRRKDWVPSLMGCSPTVAWMTALYPYRRPEVDYAFDRWNSRGDIPYIFLNIVEKLAELENPQAYITSVMLCFGSSSRRAACFNRRFLMKLWGV